MALDIARMVNNLTNKQDVDFGSQGFNPADPNWLKFANNLFETIVEEIQGHAEVKITINYKDGQYDGMGNNDVDRTTEEQTGSVQ